MLTIIARADCPYCGGSGIVTDYVPYGMGNVAMDSDCQDCVTAGWPDGALDDAEYELLDAREAYANEPLVTIGYDYGPED